MSNERLSVSDIAVFFLNTTAMIDQNDTHAHAAVTSGGDGPRRTATLASLQPGERVRILRYRRTDEVAQRLLEMGLTPGVEVTLVRRAPFGDPLTVFVRGYHLSLRRREAALLEVSPCGAPSCLTGSSATVAV